jgi:hypothetical protein
MAHILMKQSDSFVAETETLKIFYMKFSFQNVKLLPTVRSSALRDVPQIQYYSGKVHKTGGKCGTLGKQDMLTG